MIRIIPTMCDGCRHAVGFVKGNTVIYDACRYHANITDSMAGQEKCPDYNRDEAELWGM